MQTAFAFARRLWYTEQKGKGKDRMEIRNATMDDLPAIAAVEAACFPAAEAATAEEFAGRLAHCADHFWLL